VALTCTAVPGERSSDHVRWLTLGSAYTGYVTVTGTWGYDAVPGDLRRAAVEIVSSLYKDARAGGERPDYSGISKLIQGRAASIIDTYRR
jgi:hypothetical protein